MKTVLSTIFGISLLLVGACSQPNGVSQADTSVRTAVMNGIKIAESPNASLYRFVDCEAGVVIYGHREGTAAVPFLHIDGNFIRRNCK